jgi:hypothetical protein
MEIYIIIILIIFIIFLNYIDELKLIYKLKYFGNTCNTINYDNKICNINLYDNIILLYNNPILLQLYKNIFISLRKINKYDYKSYFTLLKTDIQIKISANDRLFLNWYNITYGIIKFAQDTLKKINNNYENIYNNIYNNINSLYNFYSFIEKINNNIKISQNKKYIKKKKNMYLIKLFKVEEMLQNLFKIYISNNKLNKNIIEIINKEKHINLINFKLNTKINFKKYLSKDNSNILYDYFV